MVVTVDRSLSLTAPASPLPRNQVVSFVLANLSVA
jgi:hypothetical protein